VTGAVRGVVATLVAALLLTSVMPATARGDEPSMHRVTYMVSSDQPAEVDIYYRDIDPPTWADYSHNPYEFSPKDEASLAPGHSWVREVSLVDPDQWAMVAVTTGPSPSAGTLRCELAVDGVVVQSADGPRGALCSPRHW